MAKQEEILKVLQEDLMPLEDILACMVAQKGLEGVVPFTEEFKQEITPIWEILKNTMDEFFDVIKRYSECGLDKVYFELGEYDVMFFILPGSDSALVAIVPALANRGLLEVELENARRRIIKILDLKRENYEEEINKKSILLWGKFPPRFGLLGAKRLRCPTLPSLTPSGSPP
jgi:hypothetical protein